MSLELHIIHATDFVRVDPHGQFDLAASRAALALMAGACRKRGINQALLDLRALRAGPKPVFSPADLAELVSTFREAGFTHQQRLALLYHSDPYKRTRLFAFLSTVHGWHVRAFGSFEDALHWLSCNPETSDKSERSPGERQIPVRVLKPGAKPATRRTSRQGPRKKILARKRTR
jgi:hypothetical protein